MQWPGVLTFSLTAWGFVLHIRQFDGTFSSPDAHPWLAVGTFVSLAWEPRGILSPSSQLETTVDSETNNKTISLKMLSLCH